MGVFVRGGKSRKGNKFFQLLERIRLKKIWVIIKRLVEMATAFLAFT